MIDGANKALHGAIILVMGSCFTYLMFLEARMLQKLFLNFEDEPNTITW